MELRRFAAQLFDLGARGVGLEERVIDHRRHAARRAAGGMHAQPRRAGVEHAAQPRRTAIGLHRVTAAMGRRSSRPLRCQQLFRDDLDQPLQILWVHGRPSSLRIFISRLM